MKRLAVVFLLVAGPAFAAEPPPPTPSERALSAMLQAAIQREFVATASLTAAQDQVAALTKERDELKAKVTPIPPPGTNGSPGDVVAAPGAN
jgi:hypothetical protein